MKTILGSEHVVLFNIHSYIDCLTFSLLCWQIYSSYLDFDFNLQRILILIKINIHSVVNNIAIHESYNTLCNLLIMEIRRLISHHSTSTYSKNLNYFIIIPTRSFS